MRIGFIGAGNMATGIARGWASAHGEDGAPGSMFFTDAQPDKAVALAAEISGEGVSSEAVEGAHALAEASDMVVLAVKPNVLDDVAGDLAGTGVPVISILAGTTLERLAEAMPDNELVRVMPNLGAQLRQGVLCTAFPAGTNDELHNRVTAVLALLGDVIEIEEDLIDAATTIMGCSPGYLALMAEVLVEEGAKLGLTEEQSLAMVARSMAATGELLNLHQPAALKKAVASPGGMTEAGLEALEERNLRETLRAAVDASLERVR